MASIDINETFIEELKTLILHKQQDELLPILDKLFPQDIAEIFDELDLDEAVYITSLCDDLKKVDIVMELAPSVRKRFFEGYENDEIASVFIQNMDSDDAADVLNELPSELSKTLLQSVPDKEHSLNIAALLKFPDNVAGGLMAKELIKVQSHWSIKQCTDEIRKQAEDVEYVYTVYVVNDFNELLGRISLKAILLAQESALVEDLYDENIIYENTYATGEEVAATMSKYDLVSLPIVDAFNRLVGRITFDDIIDFVKEEADKDYQMLSGISSTSDESDSIWSNTKSRLPWLLVGLVGGIANSLVIGNFEEALARNVQLALFMPLIMAMAGNVGVQSSSIIVQGLANNAIDMDRIWGRLGKEILVALINGLVCGVLLTAYGLLINSAAKDILFTVSVTLVSVILLAAIIGTIVPLILNRLKIDPALATGPFITTSNDLLGMMLYFLLANVLLGVL